MANFTKAKRKKIEDLIFKIYDDLDPTRSNTDRLKKFFKSLDDPKFTKWANKFFKDPEDNFYIDSVPYQNEPSLKNIKKAAKSLSIPLEETVTFRHLGGVQTPVPVAVGYIMVKRHQQILSKKNGMSSGISKRNQKTGYFNWLQVAKSYFANFFNCWDTLRA